MTEQDKIINLVQIADIKRDDWQEYIMDEVTNLYAKGYLRATIARLGEVLPSGQEDYRDELLVVCRYDLWRENP